MTERAYRRHPALLALVRTPAAYEADEVPARGGAEQESASAYRCTSFGHQPPPIWHCQDCEMLLPWPMRPAQDLLSAYQDVEAPLYLAEKDNRYHTVRKVVEALGPTRGRTVLDVGAHCGYFLDVACEAGFRPEGLERSRWAVGHARSQGCRVHGVPLASRGVQYDVVTLWVEWLTTLALGVVVAFAAVHLGRLASRRGTWAGSWRTRTATSPSIASRNAGRRRLVRRPGLGGRVGDGERQPLQPSAELEQAPEHAQPVLRAASHTGSMRSRQPSSPSARATSEGQRVALRARVASRPKMARARTSSLRSPAFRLRHRSEQ